MHRALFGCLVIELLLSALLVIALDQATKASVLCCLGEGQAMSFGWIVIRRVLNFSGSAGRLAGRGTLLTLWAAEVPVLLALVHIGPLFQNVVARVAIGTALGGATGNLLDRVCRKAVVDFVDVGCWPVFNVADTAIVTGAVVAIWYIR